MAILSLVRLFLQKRVVEFANLARRARCLDLAISAFRPYVKPSPTNPQTPKAEEILEYSICLIRLGALQEGLKLLESVDGTQYPEQFLYKAFAKISQWDYVESASLLEKYTALPDTSEYKKTTAKVNLPSSYIFIRKKEDSQILLGELLELTERKDFSLLRANVLRMAIQQHYQQENWAEALKYIALCEGYATSKNSLESLLLEKWKLLIQIEHQKASPEIRKTIHELRVLAETIGSDETLRELDFYEGLHFNESELLQKVYFGTLYGSYREKVLEHYYKIHKCPLKLPQEYMHLLGATAELKHAESFPFIEAISGRNSFNKNYLPSKQLLFKLLNLLVSDFYRPLTIYKIYDSLFRNEFFNPNSTPGKVHQLVFRLNAWLDDNEIPLKVKWDQDAYSFAASTPIHIKILNSQTVNVEAEENFKTLKMHFLDRSFTALDLSQELKLSRRGALNIIHSVRNAELIEVLGAGPKTRYRCK